MSDERLRTLAREAAAQGDATARARLLRERVRTGSLQVDRLALAALVGDEGARLALGDESPPVAARPGALLDALELARGATGREGLARAALAAARLALPVWAAHLPSDRRGERALAAADEAVACACSAHRAALDAALPDVQALGASGDDPWALAGALPEEGAEAQAALQAAQARAASARSLRSAAVCAAWLGGGESIYSIVNRARDAVFDAVEATSEAAVLEALRAALGAWALR